MGVDLHPFDVHARRGLIVVAPRQCTWCGGRGGVEGLVDAVERVPQRARESPLEAPPTQGAQRRQLRVEVDHLVDTLERHGARA
jgi:hypothetical protein